VGVTRTLVAWCADWPLVAAGVPLEVPAAVLRANRVVACSPAARREGVERHQRRRDAQSRCPELEILDHDPAAEARAFEPVAAALEALTPRIEITFPGACAFPTRGPSRYHGGDQALAERAAVLVSSVLGERGPVRVGVADGPFAAGLAARRHRPVSPTRTIGPAARLPGDPAPARALAPARRPRPWPRPRSRPGERPPAGTAAARAGELVLVVPPGASPAFLAPIPVTALADIDGPEGAALVDVLERLGVRTLGALAALPVAEVVGRFGAAGLRAHRLAGGLDARPPATAPPPVEWTLSAVIDPPADRVEAVAFVARGLAADLHGRLAATGSACTRLVVGAETEHGETHERVWRTEGSFTPLAIADRVRWQLEGWIDGLGRSAQRPSGGLTRLWLAPDEIVPAGGRQLALPAGGPGMVDAVEAGDRAARALARVQGLLGVEAVRVPEWRGGRGPGERVGLVPVAADDVTEPRPAARPGWVTEPWPGRVPDPAPAAVHDPPLPAEVVDVDGRPVLVSGRGVVSGPPAEVAVAGDRRRAVTAWAGPWPCDERWWDPETHRRRARVQVATDGGPAYLLAVEAGRWSVEATYD
jgi:protein ImuB